MYTRVCIRSREMGEGAERRERERERGSYTLPYPVTAQFGEVEIDIVGLRLGLADL